MIGRGILHKYKFPLIAFIAALVFHFWHLGSSELQGDEASGLLVALKMSQFYKDPKMAAHIFLFGHTPIRVLLNFFAIILGHYNEAILRFPNALLGGLSVFPFYFIARKMCTDIEAFIVTVLYAFLGLSFGNRIAMGVGPYVLFQLSALFWLLEYLREEKSININLFAFFTYLAIMTYPEAVIFFIPFIFILILNQKNIFGFIKSFWKTLIVFLICFVPFVVLWFFVPLYLYKKGMIDSYQGLGGFRILSRATGGAQIHLSHNFNMMTSYVGLIPHLFFSLFSLSTIVLSIKQHNKILLSIALWFFVPALYFHFLVTDPTNHMQFYYSYVVLLSIPTLALLPRFIKPLMVLVILIFAFIHNSKILHGDVMLEWGPQKILGLRPLARVLRENAYVTDVVYLDGVEGYVARIYFGLPYSEKIEQAHLIVTTDIDKTFPLPWKLRAKGCSLALWDKNETSNNVAAISCDNLNGMEVYNSPQKILWGILAK